MSTKSVAITSSVSVGGDGAPLLLISGPCQIESRDHALRIGSFLAELGARQGVPFVYKSSYDKANRTSIGGRRGVGIDEGLRILEETRRATGLPILTDVHSPEEASMAGEVVDVLQIPAFLCRQTDLLAAAGRTGKTVNIKKGQFLHPSDMGYAAEKVASAGNERILLCERGTCFGYRDLVVDMRSLLLMRSSGHPVIFDATHSVQSMGGAGGSSGGNRHYVLPLLRGAVAVGVDGVFVECHDNPDQAPSDGPTMVPLSEMRRLVETAVRLHAMGG